MRILLVEDTADVGEGIVARLQRMGHAVEWERDGEGALARIAVQPYDLFILDVMLPPPDGLRLLRHLREQGQATPVLMLTARSSVNDRVGALDLGADDYLVKPFDFLEMEARVRALLRRQGGSATNELRCGDITIDLAGRLVMLAGQPVELTRRELALLEILATRVGRVVDKGQIAERLFGLDSEAGSNAVEQYVARLRRKIAASRAEIRTLRGLGYQLVLR
ncbi:response regulator transcription factor [Roseomonas sp. GC11]|uniref:response regulator transcription factor n=1 Tax=Roseomonas sp. GC11 TaxID=2950546 RepID=UPI002109455E|nr:response regulator transcription factor [Roseomonas sp. GC11]MCQ4161534.1 response regulator transcription factor [Roseomonas sp. GC11]